MSTPSLALQQAWALLAAGWILYLPANLIPVMTITITGEVEPLTVFGGVMELADSGAWPAAVIVFLASMVVPLGKLACLSWILALHGSTAYRKERTKLLRIVHTIGTWSMVDIFLLSVLAAVGQLGILASVQAEPGAYFFAAVLICTLLAAECYKPRLIWQPFLSQTA